MKKTIDAIFFVFVPLLVGAVLYYVFCPETIFVEWIDKWISIGYHIYPNYDNIWLRMLRYYLFDALWAYSLMMAVLYIIQPPKNKLLIYFVGVFLFEILMESVQLFSCVKGTFDVFDILLEAIINVLVIKIYTWREYHEKEI